MYMRRSPIFAPFPVISFILYSYPVYYSSALQTTQGGKKGKNYFFRGGWINHIHLKCFVLNSIYIEVCEVILKKVQKREYVWEKKN